MNKIVLMGSGNIGSRHLQALVKFPGEMTIEIVENNSDSIKLTKSRLEELNFTNDKIQIKWKNTIDECSNESDLVIVSTLATDRANILKNLLEKGHSKFLIEKMVCQSKEEYDEILSNMLKYNALGWVNTRCRYFEFYQEIKKILENSKKIHLSMTSSFTGLGTGAIHYIDLFSWLNNDYNITLEGNSLYPNLLPNKRSKELVEFGGQINGSSDNGSLLSTSYFPEGDMPLTVTIIGENGYAVVDETNGRILSSSKNLIGLDFKVEYVSNVTTKIVSDILSYNNCLLPTLKESYHSHVELFRIFNKHIKKITNQEIKLCPIT